MPIKTSDRAAKLPDEIMDSQRTRADLLKWKLVLVSGLGAAGIGLQPGSQGDFRFLLALIPLVAVYVDLLCSNLNLRIILIGRYFAEKTDDPYEPFVGPYRIVFSLEDWALYGSSYFLSGLLAVSGIFYFFHEFLAEPPGISCLTCLALLASGLIGILLTRWVQVSYRILVKLPRLEDQDRNAFDDFRDRLGSQLVTYQMFSAFVQRVKSCCKSNNEGKS